MLVCERESVRTSVRAYVSLCLCFRSFVNSSVRARLDCWFASLR